MDDDCKFPLRVYPPRLEPSRNALRIEVQQPGPVCMHQPRREYGWWLLVNRPHHIPGDWSEFHHCYETQGCAGCRFEIVEVNDIRYKRVEREPQEG